MVTGLNFSRTAIKLLRLLTDEIGLTANFVQGRVEEAPQLTPGPFDLIFSTWGTICWLLDVKVWARIIASVLPPVVNCTLRMLTRAFLC
jgi:hypothetical protein